MSNVDDRLLRRWQLAQAQRDAERATHDEATLELLADVFAFQAPRAEAVKPSRADVFFLEDR